MVFPLYERQYRPANTPLLLPGYRTQYLRLCCSAAVGSNTNSPRVLDCPVEIIRGTDKLRRAACSSTRLRANGEVPVLAKHRCRFTLTLFTLMFMHGGIAHIAGNMLFLWIFGDKHEDRLAISGTSFSTSVCVIASLAHVFTTAVFASDQSIC